MNQSELPEVASWAGIKQGTNSVNLHAVLYSTAEKNMVYFVRRLFARLIRRHQLAGFL